MEKRKVRTAVIPVAGKGTRFLPVTRAVPKELLPLVDTPTIHHIVLEAARAGIERIVLVTGKGKFGIEDYFDAEFPEPEMKNIKITTIRQPKPLGLGHAILCAQPIVQDQPFAVLLGDDVIDAEPSCTKQLLDIHYANGGEPVVGVMEVAASETNKYGIVGGENIEPNLMRVRSLIEKPQPDVAPSRLAIPGRYILTPDIFEILAQAKPSVGGEIQLTDSLQVLANRRPLFAFQYQGQRFDAGDRLGYIEANLHFALKRADFKGKLLQHMKGLLEKHAKDL
jgi:UTP--glucose-1-phosphate uridylyltransferase